MIDILSDPDNEIVEETIHHSNLTITNFYINGVLAVVRTISCDGVEYEKRL